MDTDIIKTRDQNDAAGEESTALQLMTWQKFCQTDCGDELPNSMPKSHFTVPQFSVLQKECTIQYVPTRKPLKPCRKIKPRPSPPSIVVQCRTVAADLEAAVSPESLKLYPKTATRSAQPSS